jgi:hypothetical protein
VGVDHVRCKSRSENGIYSTVSSLGIWSRKGERERRSHRHIYTSCDNLFARKDANGGYELAYGHHRLAALKALKIDEIAIPVRNLSNTLMIKIMANENMTEWGANAAIEQETVRAVKTRSNCPKPDSKTIHNQLRYAPGFKPDGQHAPHSSGPHPYTLETLEEFLGWKRYKVKAARRLDVDRGWHCRGW